MSYSRGSSILEFIIALSIFSFALTAAIHVLPFSLLSKQRSTIEQALLQRAIQDELQAISKTCAKNISIPLLVENIAQKFGPFSEITRPQNGATGILSAQVNTDPQNTERVKISSVQGAELLTSRFTGSDPTNALGCTPTTCMLLSCANGICTAARRAYLWPLKPEIMPFIAIILPVDDISLLYLSSRNTLRRAAFNNDTVKENQPLLDKILQFKPQINFPANMHGACLIAASIKRLSSGEKELFVSALQSLVSPPIPLGFLRVASP